MKKFEEYLKSARKVHRGKIHCIFQLQYCVTFPLQNTQMYIDKLDRAITDKFYREKSDKWQEEQDNVLTSIEKHKDANANYFEQGIYILELAQRVYSLYTKQTSAERRRLLNFLLSNCTFDGVSLCPTYRKPFDLLVKGLTRPNWLPP